MIIHIIKCITKIFFSLYYFKRGHRRPFILDNKILMIHFWIHKNYHNISRNRYFINYINLNLIYIQHLKIYKYY